MPTLSTNADNLTFSAANQQWIIETGVVVGSSFASLGAVVMPSANDELVNNGILFAPQSGAGVFIGSGASSSKVTNAAAGAITAPTGISVYAAGTHVDNAGSIVGFAGNGMSFSPGVGPMIENSGYVFGQSAGILGSLIDSFTLTNSGVIASAARAIVLLVSGNSIITNTGKIKAGDGSEAIVVQVTGSGSAAQVVNQGVIVGEIDLSSGADTFNGRGGVTKGVVFGSDGNDTLTGGAGTDELHGDNGQDTISGRGGDDILIGGAAGDTLKGRGGGDDFVYRDTSDSTGNSAGTRDAILDFDGSDGDRIDLRPLDARLGNGNQKFDFIGTNAFTGQKGQLRYSVDDGNSIVQADVTGDGKADLAILVSNVSKLSADDFDL